MGKIMYLRKGGVAKLLSAIIGIPSYYGKAPTNTVARHGLGAATPVGDYAIIAGNSNKVTVYDSTLTRLTADTLNVTHSATDWGDRLCAASLEDYAFFGGGAASVYSTFPNVYGVDLVRYTASNYSNPRINDCAVAIGEYVLFAGGEPDFDNGYDTSAPIEAYTANLSRVDAGSLTVPAPHMVAASTGKQAIIAGGQQWDDTSGQKYSGGYDWAWAITPELTKTSIASLSRQTFSMTGVHVGKYALLAGGEYYDNSGTSGTVSISSKSNLVEAYDQNLTKTFADPLNTARYGMAAASLKNCALFGGGYYTKVVDCYTSELVHTIMTDMSTARHNLMGTFVGDYVLFAGGIKSASATSYLNTVDVYLIS